MLLDPTRMLELAAVGVIAGLVGGMLGVGGGLVMIPAMLLLFGDLYGPDSFHLYKLAAITASVVVSIPALLRHYRARAVQTRMLLPIVPAAAVGVALGVYLAGWFSRELTHVLRRAFGVFIELVILTQLLLWLRGRRGAGPKINACPLPSRHALYALAVGAPTGVIAGLLGIGGGAWNVPVMHVYFGMNLRPAIATSTAIVICVSLLTSIAQAAAVEQLPPLRAAEGYWLATILAPGAVLGGWLGADLTHRLPVGWLRLVFFSLLAVSGARLILAP